MHMIFSRQWYKIQCIHIATGNPTFFSTATYTFDMAAPSEMTTLDISGKFVMNKTLGDDTDEILRLQGVGWFTRKAIQMATIYLTIKHYKDDDGLEHIDIDQILTGGVGGTQEIRVLNWQERSHEDHVFGPVVGKSRRIKVEDVENDWLKQSWSADTQEHGLVNSWVQSDTPKSGKTWIAEQTWGFEEIGDARRYVRHVYFIGPAGERIQARLVYDYQGPLDS
ncbi:hypothetical protein QCA50_001983 [Cerrena zonata]|uniref:Uncharacterized protein n=1 Tax=Cerrena zonata TaxID=2478898 RepID=A0AAW0GY64_9APHY